MNYTLLHLHTMLSNAVTNIDSITSFDDYIGAAKSCGMDAIAFTEHGSVMNWVKKKEHTEAAGLKYIHGMEAYITESVGKKARDNYHCILLCKNYDGVKELNRLSSLSFNRQDGHFYYVPRITFEELIGTSENIIITTACLGGILNNGTEDLQDRLIEFMCLHKDRCFLEIQHHNVEEQILYNRKLLGISKRTGLKLVAGTDTHALNEAHLDGRKMLQKAKGVHFENEDAWDLAFKTYGELTKAYEKQDSLDMGIIEEAIENTNAVAGMVESFSLDRGYKYPHLWENPYAYFKEQVNEGAERRGIRGFPNYGDYKRRINYEYKVYKHNGAIDFILLMNDILKWCRSKGIQVGYGRGSVTGSEICYLLGITEMDSIKHGLNFERFMNSERVSLADVDTDFPPSRIEEVKQYIYQKEGLFCCDIVTFNTIAEKGAVRDIGRALGIPLGEVNRICNSLGNGDSMETWRGSYPELSRYVDLVKGTIVSVGSHPCGLVTAPMDIVGEFGTFTTSTSNYPISQINMKELDGLNYVKLDLLKLDTIEIIDKTCEMAGIERLTPDNMDIDDLDVWDSIRSNTTGIFQWSGNTGDRYIKKLLSDKNIENFQKINSKVDRMTLLSIGNSAIRPAGASYREDLSHGVVRNTGAKPIDDFLSSTFGYLVFQEQIIFFLHLYCGFSMGAADVVRRGFAKKTGTEQYVPIIKDGGYMPNDTQRQNHIPGYVATMKEKYGIDEEKSEKDIMAFLRVIEDASSYLFSLNHSMPYSYEGYAEGWLRHYYPLEFLTVNLNVNSDKEDKTNEFTEYAKRCGIQILNPQFRHSKADYVCDKDKNVIYKGIASIKHINASVADELYGLRGKEYRSFYELLIDIKESTSVNSKQLDLLIKLDFFSEFGSIKTLLKIVGIFNFIYGKKQVSKLKIEEAGYCIDAFSKYGKETKTLVKELDTIGLARELCGLLNEPENDTSDLDKMRYQIEILGYTNITIPAADKHYFLIQDIEEKKAYANLKLYEVSAGKLWQCKIWESVLEKNPVGISGLIYAKKIVSKNKREWNGEINPSTNKRVYVPVPNEYEFWLEYYVKKERVD